MGRLFLISPEEQCYSCKYCRTELAFSRHVIFDDFAMELDREHAPAYLVHRVVNVTEGEVRRFTPGGIPFVDIFCVRCGSYVGSKLVRPEPLSERDGNILLEQDRVVAP